MTHAPTILHGWLRRSLYGAAAVPAALVVSLTTLAGDETAELRIETSPGQAAPFRLAAPADGGKGYSLVIIRGLSGPMSLEPAIRSGDAWYVSAKDLPALKIVGAPDAPQVMALTASFVQPGKPASSERSISVRLEPQKGAGERKPAAPKADGDAQPAFKRQDVEATAAPLSDDERNNLAEAAALMKNGDVAAARLLFEELAEQGSARGAFAMGQTYDPNVLRQMRVQGLTADPAKARRWYEKAAALGSHEAADALGALAGGGR